MELCLFLTNEFETVRFFFYKALKQSLIRSSTKEPKGLNYQKLPLIHSDCFPKQRAFADEDLPQQMNELQALSFPDNDFKTKLFELRYMH